MQNSEYPKRLPDLIGWVPSDNFTIVPNEVLRNPSLSWKAKGLLCFLLGNSDNKWISYKKTIVNFGKDGEMAVDAGIAELEKEGYLKRIKYRDKKEKRIRGSMWIYTGNPKEFPWGIAQQRLAEHELEILPQPENLNMEDPEPENLCSRLPRSKVTYVEGKQGLTILIDNKNKYKEDEAAAAADFLEASTDLNGNTPKNIDSGASAKNQTNQNALEDGRGLVKTNGPTRTLETSASTLPKKTGKKITPSQFEIFWKDYPRKVDKGKAKTAWEKICSRRNGDRPTLREIRTALFYQKKSDRWKDRTFIPHPTTWLNQQRWLDDPSEMTVYNNKKSPKKITQAFHKSPDKKYIMPATQRPVENQNVSGERRRLVFSQCLPRTSETDASGAAHE